MQALEHTTTHGYLQQRGMDGLREKAIWRDFVAVVAVVALVADVADTAGEI